MTAVTKKKAGAISVLLSLIVAGVVGFTASSASAEDSGCYETHTKFNLKEKVVKAKWVSETEPGEVHHVISGWTTVSNQYFGPDDWPVEDVPTYTKGDLIHSDYYRVTIQQWDNSGGTKQVAIDCPSQEIPAPTAADFTIIDLCGTDEDGWLEPADQTGFTIGEPDLSNWPTVLDVVIPLTANEGYTFPGGLTETTVTLTFTDVACEVDPDPEDDPDDDTPTKVDTPAKPKG